MMKRRKIDPFPQQQFSGCRRFLASRQIATFLFEFPANSREYTRELDVQEGPVHSPATALKSL